MATSGTTCSRKASQVGAVAVGSYPAFVTFVSMSAGRCAQVSPVSRSIVQIWVLSQSGWASKSFTEHRMPGMDFAGSRQALMPSRLSRRRAAL